MSDVYYKVSKIVIVKVIVKLYYILSRLFEFSIVVVMV